MLALLLAVMVGQVATPPIGTPSGFVMSNQTGTKWPDFALTPPGGRGLPKAEQLCPAAAGRSLLQGAWWCLDGDGTTYAGSALTFADGGVPVIGDVTVCPSGPLCGTFSRVAFTSNSTYYELPSATPLTWNVTYCALVAVSAVADNIIGGAWTAGGGDPGNWYLNSRGQFGFKAANGSPALTVAPSTPTVGAWQLICGRTDSSGSTSSCVDGACGAVYASVSRDAGVAASAFANFNTAAAANTSMRGLFYTEHYLTDSEMATLAHAVLADATVDVHNVGVSVTRTGAMYCDAAGIGSSDNVGSVLPPNRNCIAKEGTYVDNGGTNLMLYSEQFDNAAWTKFGLTLAAPSVSPDSATSPGGTYTADAITTTASTAIAQVSALRQTVTTVSGNPYTCSIFVQGNGEAATTYLSNTLMLGGGTPAPCTYNASYPVRCTFSFTAGGTADGCDLGTNTYLNEPTTQPARHFYAWGGQVETGSTVTAYTPTTSAPAAHSGPDIYYDRGSALPVGCIAASYNLRSWLSLSSVAVAGDTTPTPPMGLIVPSGYSSLYGYVSGTYSSGGSNMLNSRMRLYNNGSSSTLVWPGGTATIGVASTKPTSRYVYIGEYAFGAQKANGIISNVQLDATDGGCQ